jgi:hypothetical protein
MEESKQNQSSLDLKNNQYDRETLKKHIYELNLWDILKTQKIDVTFAVRYILNSRYQLSDSEQSIDVKDVLFFQPHIDKKRLEIEMILYNSDDDSVAGFDSTSTSTFW